MSIPIPREPVVPDRDPTHALRAAASCLSRDSGIFARALASSARGPKQRNRAAADCGTAMVNLIRTVLEHTDGPASLDQSLRKLLCELITPLTTLDDDSGTIEPIGSGTPWRHAHATGRTCG